MPETTVVNIYRVPFLGGRGLSACVDQSVASASGAILQFEALDKS